VTSGVELVKLHVWRPLVVNYKTACVAASGGVRVLWNGRLSSNFFTAFQ